MNATFVGVVMALLETAVAMIMGGNYYAATSKKTLSAVAREEISDSTDSLRSPYRLRLPYCAMGVFLGHTIGLFGWNLFVTSIVGIAVLGVIWCRFLLPETLDEWRNTSDVPLLVFGIVTSLVVAVLLYFAAFGIAVGKEPNFMFLALGAAFLLVVYTEWARLLFQRLGELL